MIVPRYWAEGSAKHRIQGRQTTVRRFGWSHSSLQDAQANADGRAAEALRRILAGEKLQPREPKVPYNGAEGVPIREEIVAEHGDTIITRNSYGALCLNTPNVLFADVDFAPPSTVQAGCSLMFLLLVPAVWQAWNAGSFKVFIGLAVLSAIVGQLLAWAGQKLYLLLSGGPQKLASRRLLSFIKSHPGWRIRLYRTPAGLRALVMHRTFDPCETDVTTFFSALGTDPLYVKMCQRQHCFRARVSPKPWRIGIASHMKPRPGIWPVRPEGLRERSEWLAVYDEKATAFAACRFERELGDGAVNPLAQAVQRLHDQLSRSESDLPIA